MGVEITLYGKTYCVAPRSKSYSSKKTVVQHWTLDGGWWYSIGNSVNNSKAPCCTVGIFVATPKINVIWREQSELERERERWREREMEIGREESRCRLLSPHLDLVLFWLADNGRVERGLLIGNDPQPSRIPPHYNLRIANYTPSHLKLRLANKAGYFKLQIVHITALSLGAICRTLSSSPAEHGGA